MKNLISQAHVKWECKYHVVIFPKYRKKVLYGKIRRKIGEILRDLKGKSAVRIHKELLRTKGTLFGRTFWAHDNRYKPPH